MLSASNGDGNVFGDPPPKPTAATHLRGWGPKPFQRPQPTACLDLSPPQEKSPKSWCQSAELTSPQEFHPGWAPVSGPQCTTGASMGHSQSTGVSDWRSARGRGRRTQHPHPPMAPSHLGQTPKSSPWPKVPRHLLRHNLSDLIPLTLPLAHFFPDTWASCFSDCPEHSHLRAFALAIPSVYNALPLRSTWFPPFLLQGFTQMSTFSILSFFLFH